MAISKSQLINLKEQVALNNTSLCLSLLQKSLTIQDLQVLREQKILFKIRDLEKQVAVAEAYKEAARRAFDVQSDLQKTELYADFTTCILRIFESISREVEKQCEPLQFFSLSESMEVLDIVLDENIEHIAQSHLSQLPKPNEDESHSVAEQAEITEFILHILHGRLNDFGFAGARVLNLIAQYSNKKIRKKRKELYSKKGQIMFSALKKTLQELLNIGIYWNTLEYAIDQVSYGDWYIADLKLAEHPEVTFAFSDIKLYRARHMGIRREVIKRAFYKQRHGWLSESLQDFAISSFNAALEYYENSTRMGAFSQKDYLEEKTRLLAWLGQLDVEDELLWALGGKEHIILARYVAAVALRSFSQAAKFLFRYVPKDKGKALICAPIPIDKIVNMILEILPLNLEADIKRNIVRDGVLSQVIDLPTNRYFDIVYRPYFRIDSNQVVSLRTFGSLNWTPIVRANLIKGGETARVYGQFWEMWLANKIKEYGWLVLGQGIKIRKNRRVLTDIDILAFQEGVLLIIQVKVIAAGGFNPYEHWKAYNTIIKGAEQAAIAEDSLRTDVFLTKSLLASNRVRQTVNIVQPMVITTSSLFNGWKHKNVPIVGGDHVDSLFRGVKLTYQTANGNIIEETKYQGEKPSVEQFLQELHTSPVWDLAKESIEVEYIVDEFEHIKASFPNLKRDSTVRTEDLGPLSIYNYDEQ